MHAQVDHVLLTFISLKSTPSAQRKHCVICTQSVTRPNNPTNDAEKKSTQPTQQTPPDTWHAQHPAVIGRPPHTLRLSPSLRPTRFLHMAAMCVCMYVRGRTPWRQLPTHLVKSSQRHPSSRRTPAHGILLYIRHTHRTCATCVRRKYIYHLRRLCTCGQSVCHIFASVMPSICYVFTHRWAYARWALKFATMTTKTTRAVDAYCQ